MDFVKQLTLPHCNLKTASKSNGFPGEDDTTSSVVLGSVGAVRCRCSMARRQEETRREAKCATFGRCGFLEMEKI